MKRLSILGAVLSCFVAASVAFAAPQPIAEIEIAKKGFSLNRATNTFDTLVTIKNASTDVLAAPFRLVVNEVRPVSVSLYNQYGKTEAGKPFVEVPLPGYALQPGQSVNVPVRFVNLGKAVTNASFSVEAERLTSANTATLNVSAEFNEENGGQSVGAGFLVKVDGVVRAVTNNEGQAQIKVPTDARSISVVSAPNMVGATDIGELNASSVHLVDVTVGDSGELSAESQLRIDRLHHLMLPRNVAKVVLRFFQDEVQVKADLIELVEMRDPAGGKAKDVTHLFTIQPDGSIAATNAAFFSALGAIGGKKLLFAQILDKQGQTLFQEIPYYVSQFNVQGRLSAPPSNPGLDVAGIPVEISVLNTDIAFLSETISDGSFPLPILPAGNILVQASTSSDTTPYVASGLAVISTPVRVDVKLRGPQDVANNIPPVTTSPL